MNTNESHNFPQGDGNAAGCHSLGQSNHREGNCIKALCFNFLKKEGNAAGVNSTPGHLSRLPGNRVKARRFFLRVSQWAVSGLDDDEKMTVANTDGHSGQRGGAQSFNLISESGLYALVFKSRKPEAKTFRKWVTSEVLPALRQTGKYEVPVNAACWQPARRTVRDQMMSLRELLISSAQAVQLKMLDVGRAQQVANLSARYLETIKLEGDAVGYETLFEMPAGEGGGGLLQAGAVREGPAKPLQGMPQRSLRGTEAGEPGLQATAIRGEAGLECTQPEAGAGACEGQPPPGTDDLAQAPGDT